MRKTVRRLSGCLGQLRDGERRVLLLRAGVGPRPAFSRVRVSRRLDVSVLRVARLERRGLRRLRTLERAGGCGAAPGGYSSIIPSTGSYAGAGGATVLASEHATPSNGGAQSGGDEAEPRSDVKEEFEESQAVPPATFIPRSPGEDGLDLTLIALLVGAGMFAYAVRREFAQRQPHD